MGEILEQGKKCCKDLFLKTNLTPKQSIYRINYEPML